MMQDDGSIGPHIDYEGRTEIRIVQILEITEIIVLVLLWEQEIWMKIW